MAATAARDGPAQEVETMSRNQETEVLVVGAGPVGLFTALQLAERGIQVRVVDQEKRTASHSYALVLHPETLRTLFRSGPFRSVMQKGNPLGGIAFYDGPDRKLDIAFPEADEATPFAVVLPQSLLESVLEEELARWDVRVEWNHRVVSIEPGTDGVAAEIAKLDRAAAGYPYARMEWIVAKTFGLKASYVVGADGYTSFVRRALDIPYLDMGGGQSFSVYEFDCDPGTRDEVRVCLNPGDTDVLWPLGDGRCRFSFQIDDVSAHTGTREQLETFLRDRAPWCDLQVGEIRWTTSVLFERRLAERFGAVRVWLAGDAAHITGPVGGQSMNVGLIEGRDLAIALSEAVRNRNDQEALDRYNAARAADWRRLLSLDGDPVASDDTDPWTAAHSGRILPCLPASGTDLAGLLSGIGLRFAK